MSTRREVLKVLSVVAGLAFALPEAWAEAQKFAIPLDLVKPLHAVGGFVYLKIKDMYIMFIRDSDTTVRALDPTCTHKQCTVGYKPDLKLIVCPCHGSHYDLDGHVVKGPAKKDLTTYEASLADDKIIHTIGG